MEGSCSPFSGITREEAKLVLAGGLTSGMVREETVAVARLSLATREVS